MRTYTLSLAIGLMIISGAIAGDAGKTPAPGTCGEMQTCGDPNCCAHCGCHACCEKYCKLVCEMKEVKKTVWVVKCEDFCTSLPNCPCKCNDCCDSGCEKNCDGCCKSCNPCSEIENRDYIPPKCGKVRTKKVLEKKEITCKIPAYKCVVVYACSNCSSKCGSEKAEQPTPAALKSVPAPESKTTLIAPEQPIMGASFEILR